MKPVTATVALAAIAVAYLAVVFIPYGLAAGYYEAMVESPPATKSDVERIVGWDFSHRIEQEDSAWGAHHDLKPGEYFVRYDVFGLAPIDVVYDPDEKVLGFYSEYE